MRQTRRSIDKVVNREGKTLVNKIEERGWMILNRNYDREGDWTYVGESGTSMMGYVIANEKAEENIIEIGEGDKTKSDHVPLEVKLEGPEVKKGKERRR